MFSIKPVNTWKVTICWLEFRSGLYMGLDARKLTLLHVNNKGVDQPAHPCSLISAFVVRVLECLMTPLDTHKNSIFQLDRMV